VPPVGMRLPVYVGQAGTQSCTVAWDPVPGANMYQLEKKNPDGTYELWYEGSATQYTKTGLHCGAAPAPFTVRVRAGNEAGWGPWSADTVLQATQVCIFAPTVPPANLRVASCTKT
ncbi:MAG: fibronectin type III domain-containing protein, partial [Pseudomonadota bacterium]